MYIISACLVGEDCKYNGGNNETKWVKEFAQKHEHILICPEVSGGLPVPRHPAEIIQGKVVNTQGMDVTKEFQLGCEIEWQRIEEKMKECGEEIEGAILKAKSPSCGKDQIYDGSFSHTLTKGDGFFAAFLREKGIDIISEKEQIVEE
ncbi:MAG: DUF523 domain-containing protein [Lachnospiraceae bacterium]|nr:DUF523 domain-containing protein [Lachnospiraceae bacterium]